MDPFALLSAGVHYDKSKIPKTAIQKTHAYSVALPLPDLPRPAGSQPSKQKRKKGAAGTQQQQQEQQADDGGISLFSAAAAAQQQQQVAAEPPLPQVHSNDPHEEANVIRKALRIKVKGHDVPPPLKYWSDIAKHPKEGEQQQQQQQQQDSDDEQQEQQQQPSKKRKQQADAAPSKKHKHHKQQHVVGLSRHLMRHLEENNWSTPTPIQRQAIPALLSGRELLAVAPTGSGKTLAFVLPMLALLAEQKLQGGEAWPDAPKALLLSPTHELAAQTVRVLKQLLPGSGLRCCLLSSAPAGVVQFGKVDVLVANPLRLKILVEEGKVDLSHVTYLVLDEADKLLAMGFTEQVDALLAAASSGTITRAFFSATLPEKVEELARSVLRDPLHIVIGERNTTQHLVKQRLLFVGREAGKLLALRQLLKGGGVKPPVLVFVSKKSRAQQLHRELLYDGMHVDSISGDQPNTARAAAVENFRAGKTWVLIATDLIGRGMDFAAVNTVINYDFPSSTTDYIHRVGRTGRAGHAGEAITFFTEGDAGKLRSVAHLVKEAGSEVPDWMLHMAKQPRNRHRDRDRKSAGDGAAEDGKPKQQRPQGGSNGKKKQAAGSSSGKKHLKPKGGVAKQKGGKQRQQQRGDSKAGKAGSKGKAGTPGGKPVKVKA
ncbi:hypothetical protein OEZ86_014412 [Tetradesmus obliquus]|nr:hypothetical protein OEZ86_014412 [Tetradesmus obliquus]